MSSFYGNNGGSGGGGGTTDYEALNNLPQINNVELIGNKTLADLGIEKAPVVLTGTLVAGQTGIALTSAAILENSFIDVYTDTYGVNPTGISTVSGSITLTFKAQVNNVVVKAVIR